MDVKLTMGLPTRALGGTSARKARRHAGGSVPRAPRAADQATGARGERRAESPQIPSAPSPKQLPPRQERRAQRAAKQRRQWRRAKAPRDLWATSERRTRAPMAQGCGEPARRGREDGEPPAAAGAGVTRAPGLQTSRVPYPPAHGQITGALLTGRARRMGRGERSEPRPACQTRVSGRRATINAPHGYTLRRHGGGGSALIRLCRGTATPLPPWQSR